MPNTTWDPLDHDISVNLSGSNLIATATGFAGSCGVRAADCKNSGKYYYEIDVTSGTGANTVMGFAQGGYAWQNFTSAFHYGAVANQDGTIWFNNVSSGKNIGAFVAADKLCVAVDFGNLKFWMRRNSGNWNATVGADPATNTGGLGFGLGSGSIWLFAPMVTFPSGSSAVRTANFGDSAFSFSVPSGFTSGWPANTVTPGLTLDPATNSRQGGGSGWTNILNGNLTASVVPLNATVFVTAFGPRGTGKYYLEFYLNSLFSGGVLSSNSAVGMADTSYVGAGSLTHGAGCFYAEDGAQVGHVYVNNSDSGTTLASVPVSGNCMVVAADLDNRLIWFGKATASSDSLVWNAGGTADPLTGVGGVDFSALSASVTPLVQGHTAAAGNVNYMTSFMIADYPKVRDPTAFSSAGWTIGWPALAAAPAGMPIRAPMTIPGGMIIPVGAAAYRMLRDNPTLSRRDILPLPRKLR